LLRCSQKTAPHAFAKGPDSYEAEAFSATFFLACLAAMELEGVVLEEI
jgi:hypothetical protein